MPEPSPASADIQGLFARWGELWGVPALAERIQLRFSTRMTRKLGSARPSTGRISVASWLLEAPKASLTEVLCHEAAHVAAFELWGTAIRPHGPEWQGLMRRAGFEPRTRITLTPEACRVFESHPRVRYEHRCPVCQAVRFSPQRISRWRCRHCRELGLDGKLVIRTWPAGEALPASVSRSPSTP